MPGNDNVQQSKRRIDSCVVPGPGRWQAAAQAARDVCRVAAAQPGHALTVRSKRVARRRLCNETCPRIGVKAAANSVTMVTGLPDRFERNPT